MTRASCSECGGDVRVEARGVWREVIGWTQTRTGGGVHGIALHVPTGRYAHAACLEARRTRGEASAPRVGLYPCDECGRVVRLDDPGAWREVRAWMVTAVQGAGGTRIAFEVPLGQYRHRLCMELVRTSYAEQLELFPEDVDPQ